MSKTDDEFQRAMQGVKPLKHSKIVIKPAPVKPKVKPKKAEEPELDPFSDFENLNPVGGDDILEYAKSGVQHKVLRNLRNGKYNIEATLDLHGMTVEEARKALAHFLKKCRETEVRCALIIHGKGHFSEKPILKNKVNHWLRQTEQVLAFCSATKYQGRTGALYALLKV